MPMKDSEILEIAFKEYGLPQAASSWLIMLYEAVQVFDDYADGDEVSRAQLLKTLHDTLVFMPTNEFYCKNSVFLSPLLINFIQKWHASDVVEWEGNPNEKSFVWRAGYYDIVLAAVGLCLGLEVSAEIGKHVMNLYGDDYAAYIKEFTCPAQ